MVHVIKKEERAVIEGYFSQEVAFWVEVDSSELRPASVKTPATVNSSVLMEPIKVNYVIV